MNVARKGQRCVNETRHDVRDTQTVHLSFSMVIYVLLLRGHMRTTCP